MGGAAVYQGTPGANAREEKDLSKPWNHGRDLACCTDLVIRWGKEEQLEVTIIFKIAAVGILVSVLSQILKHSGREEQAFLVSLAGLLIVLFWIVPYIYDLFESIQQLFTL